MHHPVMPAWSKPVSVCFFVLWSLLCVRYTLAGNVPTDIEGTHGPAAAPKQDFHLLKLVFEPDAYYTDLDLIVSLTEAPIPNLGELSEAEFYRTLLTRAAVLPQFLVLEASVNPLPFFGTYIKKNEREFYDNARVSGSLNWVQAVTAGFEEPYAFSVLAGNVADFNLPNGTDTEGLGYSGYLFSTGNYHIKDNELVRDVWHEFEWKLKGDRRSPVKKLSWSFRIGAKLHGNPNITDILYLSFRRSRVDYKYDEWSLFRNSGFEYTYDMDWKTLRPIRHYFYVDKKWPFGKGRMVAALAVGFVWESASKYGEELAPGKGSNTQILLRPNIEF